MQSRRDFFKRMMGAAAAAVAATETDMLDPERLLWVPGKKTIFIPEAPRIRMAEDVAVEQIREQFTKPRIVEADAKIYRPDEMLPLDKPAMGRVMDGRYTLTVPDGRGGILQQHYNSDWSKNGGVTRRGRGGFEELRREATVEEARHFIQQTEVRDLFDRDARGAFRRMAMSASELDRRMDALDAPSREFMTRFKEKG